MSELDLKFRFSPHQASAAALERWFLWLHNKQDSGKGGQAERATLRRAQAPQELILTPGLRSLLHSQGIPACAAHDADTLVAVAMIAGALAHCKQHNDKASFAAQLAMPADKGGKAPMSEARFSRLQKSRDHDEFYRNLVRAIALVRGKVNIISLADSILHWCQEYRYGVNRQPIKRLAVSWAQDYYAALPAN